MPRQMNYMRQAAIFNPDNHAVTVTVVGLGNIGSHAALTLARLGVAELHLIDNDQVENHNLTSQAYSVEDLGQRKANALADRVRAVNPDVLALAYVMRYGEEEGPIVSSQFTVIAVDTMEERRRLHGRLTEFHAANPELAQGHILDARVGGPQVELYTARSVEEWGQTFVDNPGEDPCGGRFICYVSVIAGALITNQIRKIALGEPYDTSLMLGVNTMEVIKNYQL